MQYRVLAARILKKLPRPFAREDTEGDLTRILQNRRVVKIGEQMPFHQLKEDVPELVRLLQLDTDSYWEKITSFCRYCFHILYDWVQVLAKSNYRTIPSELLFLLEKPEELIRRKPALRHGKSSRHDVCS